MSINQTSVDSNASNNSSICTEEWDSASPVNLCKIYNWFGGLTNLFRKTGEVVFEISPDYGNEVKIPPPKKISLTTSMAWQIQDFADYADISVDRAVDYVLPIIKGIVLYDTSHICLQ